MTGSYLLSQFLYILYHTEMAEGTSHEQVRHKHSLSDHLNAFSDGIFISDRKGLCHYTNDALCIMLGYDYAGALSELNILDFVAPEFRDDLANALEQKGNTSILPLRKKNGQMILAEITFSFTNITDLGIGVSAIVRNLSERNIPPALKDKIAVHYPRLVKYLPPPPMLTKHHEKYLIGTNGINKREFQLNVVMQEIKTGFDKELNAQGCLDQVLYLSLKDPDPTRSITTDREIFIRIVKLLLRYIIRNSQSKHIEFGYHIEQGIYPLFFIRDFSSEIPQNSLNHTDESLKELSGSSFPEDTGKIRGPAQAQKLVSLLNGNIWAKAGQTENLVFYFHVGKERIISHARIHDREDSDREIEWESKNILVVEDMPYNYLYIEAILRKTRANLIHVTNGADAVKRIESDSQIDLILMDIRLPGMDGYETTRKIKGFRPNVPVIAVTAYTLQEEEEKISKAGIDGYVSKPIYSDDLISTMNEVMRMTPRKFFRLKKWVH